MLRRVTEVTLLGDETDIVPDRVTAFLKYKEYAQRGRASPGYHCLGRA
jgi:hypothetical protein